MSRIRPCSILRHGWLWPLLWLALAAEAVVIYQPGLDRVEWRVESSVFACRLWQPIPDFGSAVFEIRAGGELVFRLNPTRNPLRSGRAVLIADAPHWAPDKPVTALGDVTVVEGNEALRLGESMATRLLTELHQGMAPVFQRLSWYADDVELAVAMSPARFRPAYREYQACLAELLPASFEQIARSRVLYATDVWQLDEAGRATLDLVVRYLRADPGVEAVFIDGHTDSVGRGLYNLELSRKRAETVTEYLLAQGVDERLITTRYHGQRYPVVPNTTEENRAENRRVTIRLERSGV